MTIGRAVILLVLGACLLSASGNLNFYFIDVEEGNSTLIVSPSGESLLMDAGSKGGRDAERVLAALKRAGLQKIDYLLVTHYQNDHYGAVPELATKIPVLHVLDHGPSIETGKDAAWKEHWQLGTDDKLYEAYCKVRDRSSHTVLKPGDRIPIKGIDVFVLAAAGKSISTPLKGAGNPNRFCEAGQSRPEDETEDGQSAGILITFGKFRFVHLGDLPWNKSLRLFCPNDPIGPVDVYLTTHHGMSIARETNAIRWGRSCCPEAEVYALRPRVAILNCGENYHRRGTPGAWQVIRRSPGLEDFWQIHYQAQGGPENNVPERFIANLSARNCQAFSIKLSAASNGSFTVENTRNNFTRSYGPRGTR